MANNLFLNAQDILTQSNNTDLNYINYENIADNNKEFLINSVWDFDFTQPAAAVYFPGNALLKARMRSVSPQFNTQLGMMTAVIRQFQVNQTTASGTTAGSLSIEYTDREDQAITAWLEDWRNKYGDRDTRYAFRKEDLCAEGRLIVMNSSRRPLKTYIIHCIQLQDPGQGLNPQLGSDDPQNIGDISASFSFEHYEFDFNNIG